MTMTISEAAQVKETRVIPRVNPDGFELWFLSYMAEGREAEITFQTSGTIRHVFFRDREGVEHFGLPGDSVVLYENGELAIVSRH